MDKLIKLKIDREFAFASAQKWYYKYVNKRVLKIPICPSLYFKLPMVPCLWWPMGASIKIYIY